MNKLNLKNLLITFVSAIVMSSSAAVADGHIKYTVTSGNVAEYAGGKRCANFKAYKCMVDKVIVSKMMQPLMKVSSANIVSQY